jgi:hypothetical protein
MCKCADYFVKGWKRDEVFDSRSQSFEDLKRKRNFIYLCISWHFMRHITTLIFLLVFYFCSGQTQLDNMIVQLQKTNFGNVYQVKDSIVNKGKEAIPKLIELLKDTSFVKLKNTADLIYPGAEKFYGHGWVVNYDIDWISVRAAWLLEEITFQDFGYRELSINEDKLMNLHKENYTSYLQSGSHDIDFKNTTPGQQLIIYRLMLADSVSKWWERNKDIWTRYNALKNALSGSNVQQQSAALHFLRFEETRCEGLTLDKYKSELKPLVEKIKESKNEEADQAQYLLNDKEFYWFKIKQKKSGS